MRGPHAAAPRCLYHCHQLESCALPTYTASDTPVMQLSSHKHGKAPNRQPFYSSAAAPFAGAAPAAAASLPLASPPAVWGGPVGVPPASCSTLRKATCGWQVVAEEQGPAVARVGPTCEHEPCSMPCTHAQPTGAPHLKGPHALRPHQLHLLAVAAADQERGHRGDAAPAWQAVEERGAGSRRGAWQLALALATQPHCRWTSPGFCRHPQRAWPWPPRRPPPPPPAPRGCPARPPPRPAAGPARRRPAAPPPCWTGWRPPRTCKARGEGSRMCGWLAC